MSVSAALLNGYADLSERIAKSKNIELENALGNTNRDLISFLNISIFGFLFMVIGRYLYRKGKK